MIWIWISGICQQLLSPTSRAGGMSWRTSSRLSRRSRTPIRWRTLELSCFQHFVSASYINFLPVLLNLSSRTLSPPSSRTCTSTLTSTGPSRSWGTARRFSSMTSSSWPARTTSLTTPGWWSLKPSAASTSASASTCWPRSSTCPLKRQRSKCGLYAFIVHSNRTLELGNILISFLVLCKHDLEHFFY